MESIDAPILLILSMLSVLALDALPTLGESINIIRKHPQRVPMALGEDSESPESSSRELRELPIFPSSLREPYESVTLTAPSTPTPASGESLDS